MEISVTVLVPVFNVESYLVECMDSIINQKIKNIQIICINDGSTDSSLEILKKYASLDQRIKIINKKNEGYGKALNDGFAIATGEYIAIVEPDDYIPYNMLSDLYEIAVKNELDFVKADFYRFITNKNGDMKLVYNHLDRTKFFYNTIIDTSKTPEVCKFILNTWCGIYNRKFLKKFNILHNTTPGASFQDNGFFWQTTIYAKRAMFINKPYYLNRRDNPNSSVKSKNKVYCMSEEMNFIQKILERDPIIWDQFKTYFALRAFGNYLFTLSRIDFSFKKEYVSHLHEILNLYNKNNMIDINLYSLSDRKKINLLINKPKLFYYKYVFYKKYYEIFKTIKKSKFIKFTKKILICLLIIYFLYNCFYI